MSIEKFAIWARKELIKGVSQRASFFNIAEKSSSGDDKAVAIDGRVLTEKERAQRKALLDQIALKGYNNVIEEVAYTWFNRIVALPL